MQLRYSLLDRGIEREHLALAHAQDMAITAWGALGSGVLSGKYNQTEKPVKGRASRWDDIEERSLTIAAEVIKIAGEIGCKPSQVALNWVRQQPGLILPIIGARTVDQIKDNLAMLDFTLDADQLARLDQVSHFDPGFPYNFLSSDEVRNLISGGTFDLLDNHRAG
jgi:aryl-alcohol dehydrogenase-like predicted oxidoreductase